MRKSILLLCFCAAQYSAIAEAVIDFTLATPELNTGQQILEPVIDFTVDLSHLNSTPPGPNVLNGAGSFTLDGLELRYDFRVERTISSPFAGLHGPAAPGEDAPLLYSLNPFVVCRVPLPGGGGRTGCEWRGTLPIQESDIPDLANGLWYVEVVGVNVISRGQLTVVPEPGFFGLITLTTLGLMLYAKNKRSDRGPQSSSGSE